ncbi:MAG: oligosaccharide flippase family protein [Pseudomonadota bacterium]
MKGSGLKARFSRTSGLSVLTFGASKMLRLISNLILTRLLFPEAFGTMALVTVLLTGLQMFSETGVRESILQSKRGEEPAFLNTAWTIQIIRGAILWLLTIPLGMLAAEFYEVPELAMMLPVGGVILFIEGFRPTWFFGAQRKLQIGRLTVLGLASGIIGLIATATLAWWLQSVWALIYGMIVSRISIVILLYLFRQGALNQLQLERDAVWELLHFGKWLFISTICGFLNREGDKLILGKYLALATLGFYQIAYLLASVPQLLGVTVYNQVLIPYLREKPPAQSRANFLAFRRIRMIVTGGLACLTLAVALLGPFLVGVLYDDRYAQAGSIVVMISLVMLPALIVEGYSKISLHKGNSRDFAASTLIRTVLNISFMLIGISYAGIFGALIGLGLGRSIHYPVVARLAHRYGAWDPKLDLALVLFAACGSALVVYLHHDALLALMAL